MKLINLILIGFLTSASQASAKETWTFTSKYDRFNITYEAGNFFYNGKAIQGSWAEDLRPILDNDMNIECEGLPKKPDLRIKWERDGDVIHRKIFLKQKVASDGKNCLDLTGPGVYYAPFHKAWFVGSEKLSLSLRNGFEIGSELSTWAKLENSNGKLVSADPNIILNWETVEKLKTVLTDFPLSGRAHPDVFQDPERNLTAKNIILKAGGKTYNFRQVKGGTWLMQMPKVPWLVLSPNFGFLDNMTAETWKSYYSDSLVVVKNHEAPVEKRIEAIRKLKAKSSKDIFNVFHEVLLGPVQNEKVKSEIVRTLRNYPSNKNMYVLAQALEKTESSELMHEITRVLRLRNPKGPQIEANADIEDIEKAVAEWLKWAAPLAKKP